LTHAVHGALAAVAAAVVNDQNTRRAEAWGSVPMTCSTRRPKGSMFMCPSRRLRRDHDLTIYRSVLRQLLEPRLVQLGFGQQLLSLAFSVSSWRRRLASSAFMPPY
jgi:hypothetical protein